MAAKPLTIEQANETFVTDQGPTIAELSRRGDVLVLFLRHSGCTFCRQALADLAKRRQQLSVQGITPVLVHMSGVDEAKQFFQSFGLEDMYRVSDPQCELYRSYGLQRASTRNLLNPRVWYSGFKSAVVDHHGFGKFEGDTFQMPGVFLVRDNKLIKAYRHETPADRPDVLEFACPIQPATPNTSL